jgi:hypothetical protein
LNYLAKFYTIISKKETVLHKTYTIKIEDAASKIEIEVLYYAWF